MYRLYKHSTPHCVHYVQIVHTLQDTLNILCADFTHPLEYSIYELYAAPRTHIRPYSRIVRTLQIPPCTLCLDLMYLSEYIV